MANTITKAIWISYDLGVKGDYSSLYTWLDNHEASECGDSVAFLKYELPEDEELSDTLKIDLEKSVNFGKTDRVYVIWKNEKKLIKGSFIIGKRKASPWQGYGDSETVDDQ